MHNPVSDCWKTFLLAGAIAIGASNAEGALTLALVPESANPVTAGSVVPIDLELIGTRTTPVLSVELTLSTLIGGAMYVAQGQYTTGFAESPTLTNDLPFTIDGSLMNDLSLAFSTFGTGIPTGSDTLLLGTFWVQTPANTAASYPVNLAFSELLDSNINQIAVVNSGASLQTAVSSPEPSAAVFACASAIFLRRQRRRLIPARTD